MQTIPAPWYEYTPVDFVAENFVPGQIHDQRTLDFQLEPQVVVPTEQLLSRAEQLRRGVHRTAPRALRAAGGVRGTARAVPPPYPPPRRREVVPTAGHRAVGGATPVHPPLPPVATLPSEDTVSDRNSWHSSRIGYVHCYYGTPRTTKNRSFDRPDRPLEDVRAIAAALGRRRTCSAARRRWRSRSARARGFSCARAAAARPEVDFLGIEVAPKVRPVRRGRPGQGRPATMRLIVHGDAPADVPRIDSRRFARRPCTSTFPIRGGRSGTRGGG